MFIWESVVTVSVLFATTQRDGCCIPKSRGKQWEWQVLIKQFMILGWVYFFFSSLTSFKSCWYISKKSAHRPLCYSGKAADRATWWCFVSNIEFAFLFHPANSKHVVHSQMQKKKSTEQSNLYFSLFYWNTFGYSSRRLGISLHSSLTG